MIEFLRGGLRQHAGTVRVAFPTHLAGEQVHLRWRHAFHGLGDRALFQQLRHLSGAHRRGEDAEHGDHLCPQVARKRGFGQQLAAIAQVQAHPVKLAGSDFPEARDLGTENHLRNQVAPNQRLGVRRNQEVLFGFGQRVGQGGQ